jgi:23S rRNA pseudouridine1911/1915/1917 synthase
VRHAGAPDRLDRAVAAAFDLSRRQARVHIADGEVFVAGRRCKVASRTVRTDEVIRLLQPPAVPAPSPQVMAETASLWVLDKPPGLHVNRTDTTARRALVEWLGPEARVVHRLDRDTSGVMVVAKTDAAAAALSEAFRRRDVDKLYDALCTRVPEASVCEAPLGPDPRRPRAWAVRAEGKPARTEFEVRGQVEGLVWVEARPLTGRTHQVRLHAQALRAPILGDLAYGGTVATRAGERTVRVSRVMLHARRLAFTLDGRVHVYEAPWPEDFDRWRKLTSLREESRTDS